MGDLIDFTLSNARRFYSSKGNNSAVKGLSRSFLHFKAISLKMSTSFMAADVSS